jgi:hypothetical protein
LQYDFGAGPVIEGVAVMLFCAWLAWSRYRVIMPRQDKSLPSVITALDPEFPPGRRGAHLRLDR